MNVIWKKSLVALRYALMGLNGGIFTPYDVQEYSEKNPVDLSGSFIVSDNFIDDVIISSLQNTPKKISFDEFDGLVNSFPDYLTRQEDNPNWYVALKDVSGVNTYRFDYENGKLVGKEMPKNPVVGFSVLIPNSVRSREYFSIEDFVDVELLNVDATFDEKSKKLLVEGGYYHPSINEYNKKL